MQRRRNFLSHPGPTHGLCLKLVSSPSVARDYISAASVTIVSSFVRKAMQRGNSEDWRLSGTNAVNLLQVWHSRQIFPFWCLFIHIYNSLWSTKTDDVSSEYPYMFISGAFATKKSTVNYSLILTCNFCNLLDAVPCPLSLFVTVLESTSAVPFTNIA